LRITLLLEKVFVFVNNLLHLLRYLRLVSFLATLLVDVRFVFFDEAFFLGDDLIFLLNDTVESFFFRTEPLNRLVFIAVGQLAL